MPTLPDGYQRLPITWCLLSTSQRSSAEREKQKEPFGSYYLFADERLEVALRSVMQESLLGQCHLAITSCPTTEEKATAERMITEVKKYHLFRSPPMRQLFWQVIGRKTDAIKLGSANDVNGKLPSNHLEATMETVANHQIIVRQLPSIYRGHILLKKLASDPKTPAEVLSIMSRDPGTDVRLAIAENPRTPVSAIEQLANDNRAIVRYAIIENPAITDNLLIALTADVHPNVAKHAKHCLLQRQLDAMATHPDTKLKVTIARNPEADEFDLAILAMDKHIVIRLLVAENPKTSQSVLVDLSHDECGEVRAAVADNPNTPEYVRREIRYLAYSESGWRDTRSFITSVNHPSLR